MKVFFWLFMVVAIWVGLELYTEGTDRAFGGKLAALAGGEPGDASARPSPLEQLRGSVSDAQREHAERARRSLGDDAREEDADSENGPGDVEDGVSADALPAGSALQMADAIE